MADLKLSKENLPSKLYEKDLNHIKKKVATDGITDTRFKDKSSTIRHYVRLGIATEKRTETANTLDDKIIKASQKEVVTDSLLPLKNTLDDLITAVESFGKKQDEHFSESRKQTDAILRGNENLKELVSELRIFCSEQFGKVISDILINNRISEEALRNAIILRSILYVFLIGIKNGRVEPDDRTPWQTLIKFAHIKAKEMTNEEMQRILTGELETTVVERLAETMFTELKRLQPKPIAIK